MSLIERIITTMGYVAVTFLLVMIWSYIAPPDAFQVDSTEELEVVYNGETFEVDIPKEYNMVRTLKMGLPFRNSVFIESDYATEQIAEFLTPRLEGESDLWKAYKVSSFVNQNVTYRADAIDQWKLPWETLRDGYGDCEDMAVLGLSILRNMDVESYMAVELGHVLAAIPDSNGYVYIEMTAEKYPWGVEAYPYVILPSGWNVYAVAMLGVYLILLAVLIWGLKRK